jgi:hypothetical protein
MNPTQRLVKMLRKRASVIPTGPAIALPARRDCPCVACVRARAEAAARREGPNADRTRIESSLASRAGRFL